jgi:hypothetical protein
MEITEPINYKINFSEEDVLHSYYAQVVDRLLNKEFPNKKDEVKKLIKDCLYENIEGSEE